MASKIVFESPRVVISSGPAPRPPARSPLPVIVGCPRSGTSLLAVMLDSHPQLAIPPETSFLAPIASAAGASRDARRDFFNCVTADRIPVSNWSDFGLDRDLFWQRL